MVSRANKADMWRNEKKRLAARANVFMLPLILFLKKVLKIEKYSNFSDLKEIVWALIDDKIFRILERWETQKQLIIQNITQLPGLVINKTQNSNIFHNIKYHEKNG